MSTKSFPLVRGRKMRVTRLDSCGRPVYGDCGQVVSDGFISVALTANTDDGEEISVTNAAGKVCVQDTPCTTFKGYGVEVTFCEVDPAIFAIMSGQDQVVSADGDIVGFRMNGDVSACDSGYALELWAGVPGAACSDEAQGAYGYILLPFVQGGVLGDFTIENAAINFVLTGANTKRGAAWGTGPYDVVLDAASTPAPLDTPIEAGDHLHVQYTEVAPPEDTVGCVPLLDPAGAAITSVTYTPTGLAVAGTLTPSGSDPAWVDWGDGSYTYYPTGTGISHTYAATGTYSTTTYRGSSSFPKDVAVTGP